MKRIFALALVTTLCLTALTLITTAQQPCAGITSLADCPDAGCGGGDSQLNRRKNRTINPTNVQTRTLSQLRQFSQPHSWPSGQDRSSLAFRENTAVSVKGYLSDARKSGRESTNCRLTGEANNDFHLDLVSFRGAPRASAVTAEITPRLRKGGWEFEKLDYLGEEEFYVRVTGWLMLDTIHISNPIVRSTNWEIHPVTKFEVCTRSRAQCNRGNGWVLLENWEFPE